MSKISLAPDASGTGIFTIASPNSNTNRTLTLPDDTGTIVTDSGNQAGSFTTLNTSGAVVFNDAGADVDFRVEGDTDANLLFVDASTDRVGIGTSSPSVKFEVNGRVLGESVVAGNALYVWSQDRMSLGASYGIESQQSSPFFLLTNSAQPIVFGTNNTERMRITSIGDFYIGRTSDTDGAGLTLDVSGFIRCNRDGATPMVVNRNTDDGTLISLRQAGTVVGEIGTTGGELYIDFGGSTGGAVTSRTLDDYEEGTWTPVVSDAASAGNLATLDAASTSGVYTKIGNIVYWRFSVVLTSKASMTAGNLVFIQGFPFTSAIIGGNWYNPFPTIIRNITFTGYVQFNQTQSSTRGHFRENVSNANGDDIIVSDLTDSAAMQASGFYRVA